MQNAGVMLVVVDEFEDVARAARERAVTRDELFRYKHLFPGTPMGVRAALMLDVPHLVEASVDTSTPFLADVRLELPAWALLMLGLLHLITWRRARRVLQTAAPSNVATRITVGVRRIAPAALDRAAAAPSPARAA